MSNFTLATLTDNYLSLSYPITLAKTEKLMKMGKMQVRHSTTGGLGGIIPEYLAELTQRLKEAGNPDALDPIMVCTGLEYSPENYKKGDYIIDRRHGLFGAHANNFKTVKAIVLDFKKDFNSEFILVHKFALWLNKQSKPQRSNTNDDIKEHIRKCRSNGDDVDAVEFKAEMQEISGFTLQSIAKLIESVKNSQAKAILAGAREQGLREALKKHRTYSPSELRDAAKEEAGKSGYPCVYVEAENGHKMVMHLVNKMREAGKNKGTMLLYQGSPADVDPYIAAESLKLNLKAIGADENSDGPMAIKVDVLINTQPL